MHHMDPLGNDLEEKDEHDYQVCYVIQLEAPKGSTNIVFHVPEVNSV